MVAKSPHRSRQSSMAEVYLNPVLAKRFSKDEIVHWAATAQGEVYRQVKARSTLRVSIDDRAYFLKRHSGVGWREILKNWAVGKRAVVDAQNEYQACLHLAACQVPAPKVAAFANQGGCPAARHSFVLCEELAGYESLETVAATWTEKPPAPIARRRLILATADFVRRLHEAGVVHRDLYICHLLVNRVKWVRGEAVLAVLDLHRARLQAPVPAFWRKRDLAALLFSTLDLNLPRFSQLRFVRAYTGRPLPELFKRDGRFWRAVERRAKALHEKARRQHLSH